MQAETDKTEPEETKPLSAAADLKPGERKVISEGGQGPVVEIIRRSTADAAAAEGADQRIAATPRRQETNNG